MSYYVTELFREEGVSGWLREPVGLFESQSEAETIRDQWVKRLTGPLDRVVVRSGVHFIRSGKAKAHAAFTIELSTNEEN